MSIVKIIRFLVSSGHIAVFMTIDSDGEEQGVATGASYCSNAVL